MVPLIGPEARMDVRPVRSRRLGTPTRVQRVGRDDPRRDGGEEALGVEGAEGRHLVLLHVARGPVVQQDEAEDVVGRGGLGGGDGGAARDVAGDEGGELDLEVQLAGWLEGGARGGVGGEEAGRPDDGGAGEGDGGEAAVV